MQRAWVGAFQYGVQLTKKEPTDPNLNLEDMISLGVTYPIEVFSNPATALQLLVDPHNKRLAGSLWTGFYYKRLLDYDPRRNVFRGYGGRSNFDPAGFLREFREGLERVSHLFPKELFPHSIILPSEETLRGKPLNDGLIPGKSPSVEISTDPNLGPVVGWVDSYLTRQCLSIGHKIRIFAYPDLRHHQKNLIVESLGKIPKKAGCLARKFLLSSFLPGYDCHAVAMPPILVRATESLFPDLSSEEKYLLGYLEACLPHSPT